jgi:hypothetical protein
MSSKRKFGKDAKNYRHGGYVGGYPSPEMRTYQAMISRCYNPNSDHWERYGARGVTVDPRWLGKNGFKNFCIDMGSKQMPLDVYTLGRILDCPLYSKATCEWQTRIQQGAERRGANAAARLHYHHLFPQQGLRFLANIKWFEEMKMKQQKEREERRKNTLEFIERIEAKRAAERAEQEKRRQEFNERRKQSGRVQRFSFPQNRKKVA